MESTNSSSSIVLIHKCCICHEYKRIDLYRICTCNSSFFCENCLAMMGSRGVKNCPICRRQLEIKKHYKIYENIILFLKPISYAILYILYVIIPLTTIYKLYYNDTEFSKQINEICCKNTYKNNNNYNYCNSYCNNNYHSVDCSKSNKVDLYFSFMDLEQFFLVGYLIQKFLLLPGIILLWNIITNYSIISEIIVITTFLLDLLFVIVFHIKERSKVDVRIFNIALSTAITIHFLILLLIIILRAVYLYLENANKKIIYTSSYAVFEIYRNPPFPTLINNYVEREMPNTENEELRLEEINPYNLEDFEELPALQPRRLTTTV